MLFEIKNCYVAEVRDNVSGVSQNGNAWTKATVIIEHKDGNYTDSYPMQAFGDKVQQVADLAGQYVDVKFDIRGREYNGRWYTDIRLQFIKPAAVEEQQQATARPKPAERPATVDWTGAPAKKEDNPDEDLPF